MWRKAPQQGETLPEGHGRPILCCAVHNELLVTGSADHGLRLFNLRSREFMRELFAKRYGHTEWVTACQFTADGRVVSGGHDSRICLWDKTGVRCNDLTGHSALITQIEVDNSNVMVSSSYDGGLLVWDVRGPGKQLAEMRGAHKHPVNAFTWQQRAVVSGGKDGTLVFWDINDPSKPLRSIKPHQGCVSKLCFFGSPDTPGPLVATAGMQDGMVCYIDGRVGSGASAVRRYRRHDAAINALMQGPHPHTLWTGAADSKVLLHDLRQPDTQADPSSCSTALPVSGQVMCGCTLPHSDTDVACFGTADGKVVCASFREARVLWTVRGSMGGAAIHCMKACGSQNVLVVGGDDCSPTLLSP
ncbi:unnamed protein product [Vitrella brassicaformis CCMP3155]|uniref:Uncharacterized protein n=1 Tax=Vitrella brassicaformis (strain CCMP3155) TaxID=1169540 RepID=A0A0G4EA11_VITBC|nr:unnamed protein product [Vitrella brassicaformis CCMP3155]|eukprot:CEL92770.1 unnamed protein product [Vitrella brassicaformis CCMP3155]